MELAVASDHVVPEKQQVRLKLHFEDAAILSPQQIHEGLCDSWFLLGRHLHSIADLASNIVIAFGLRSSCPHGISLRMENFTLPSSQPIELLKDKDIVSVNRKGVSLNVSEHAFSSSFETHEKIALLGVKTEALQEFERETGGYESEEEEERDACENFPTNVNDEAPRPSLKKSKEKKRKREKVEKIEEQGLGLVPYTTNAMNKKDKAKKLKRQRLADQQAEIEKLNCAHEGQKWQTSREVQKNENSKVVKTKAKKKDKASKGYDSIKEHAGEKEGIMIGRKGTGLSASLSDKEREDEEKTTAHHEEGEIIKKCSRSTLRKKAKRRWKRENLGSATKAICEPGDNRAKLMVKKVDAEQVCVSFRTPTKHEDDGDAEEERLPRVVRPGHIRFQASDEDDDDRVERLENLLPSLGWTNGISKRKGQSWGQERTKRGNNSFQDAVDAEIDDIQDLKLETLPGVEGTPQCGDVIAYRILELTPSCCPELSEYRVGKVLELESQSGRLKLADVPKYRVCKHDAHNPPLHEDGVLETDISSLADILLVERCLHESSGRLETPVQASTEVPVDEGETNLKMVADTGIDTSKICNGQLDSSIGQSVIDKNDSALLQGWEEISEAFRRKREELGNEEDSAVPGVVKSGNGEVLENKLETVANLNNTELEKPRIQNGGSSAGNRLSSSGARGWHRKAGGLGSTMALLRSQNVV